MLYVINKNFLRIYKSEYFILSKKKNFSGYNIRMLEITIGNCYKCDLETMIQIIVNIFRLIEEI